MLYDLYLNGPGHVGYRTAVTRPSRARDRDMFQHKTKGHLWKMAIVLQSNHCRYSFHDLFANTAGFVSGQVNSSDTLVYNT